MRLLWFGFRKDGFLSTTLSLLVWPAFRQNREYFALCRRLNRVSHQVLLRLRMGSKEPVKLLGALVALRLVQSLQSAYLLARAGLQGDASVALRTAFEASVQLRACRVRPELALAAVAGDKHEQLKLANANIGRLKAQGRHERAAQLEEAKAELERALAASGAREISTFELANATGFKALYDTMYRIVSKYAHVSPRALDGLVVQEGHDLSVRYGPDLAGVRTLLLTVADLSLKAQADIAELFGVEAPPEQSKLREEFEQLLAAEDS